MVKTTKTKQIPERYFEAVGRRKTSVARVRLHPKKSGITINGMDYKEYFKMTKYQTTVFSPFEVMKIAEKFGVSIKVSGGGLTGQAEAIRHGISRALVKVDETYRKRLRAVGYLTRDSRMVERKKYGKKKARRSPQWAKR